MAGPRWARRPRSPCGEHWEIHFTLPPELQVPGSDPLFPELDATVWFDDLEDPERGGGSGGGGTLEGIAELDVVDETGVCGRLVDTFTIDFDADIVFDARRCP